MENHKYVSYTLYVQVVEFLIMRTLAQFSPHPYMLHVPPISNIYLMILIIFTTQLQLQLYLLSTTDKDEGLVSRPATATDTGPSNHQIGDRADLRSLIKEVDKNSTAPIGNRSPIARPS
jgi:hypothetical protein